MTIIFPSQYQMFLFVIGSVRKNIHAQCAYPKAVIFKKETGSFV